MMQTVIGIDPGLAATGVGIVRGHGLTVESFAYGDISTSKKYSLPERLDRIFSKLSELLREEKPDLIVVEDVFSLEKYPKSGIILGKVSGVILLAGERTCAPVVEVAVREAKKILTGSGNAGKAQLEESVRHLLNKEDPIKPFHASDALALALIGLFRYTGPQTRLF
jgi:crossover junction endodeoxyribonuclease RuvC